MLTDKNSALIYAGWLSIVASLLHLACILGGPEWYRFFGAGEHMAHLAEQRHPYPTIATLIIATIIGIWALYAFCGAGYLIKLPLQKTVLVLISIVFLCRGLAGLILPFVLDDPVIHQNTITFWIISSLICLTYAYFYTIGTFQLIKNKKT